MEGDRLAEVVDADGRLVQLDGYAFAHIVARHPEMRFHMAEIMETVALPDHRARDPRRERERYYKRGVGPSRWLLVVVDFEMPVGRVVTAYANRTGPRL